MEDRLSPEDLEYLSQFEESEGKQNDLMETDPPTSQNTETSVGESNSGDISLGSPVVDSDDSYMGMGAITGRSGSTLP